MISQPVSVRDSKGSASTLLAFVWARDAN